MDKGLVKKYKRPGGGGGWLVRFSATHGVGHAIFNRNRDFVKKSFFNNRGLDSVEIADNKFKAWQLKRRTI